MTTRRGRCRGKLFVIYLPTAFSLHTHTYVSLGWSCQLTFVQFYNAVLFMGSIAVFSLIAQRLNATK